MRVLACGGRDFEDRALVQSALDQLHAAHAFSVLIEGDARGADRLAGEWADLRGIAHIKFLADWQKHRRAAGPIRNEQMLREGKPDLVVAFAGGKGTAHMIRLARDAGVPVIEIASNGGNGSSRELEGG